MITLTILGCGTSTGVPSVEYGWGACDPSNTKNIRLNTSLYASIDGVDILFDTGTDLRQQLLASHIVRADGIIYTHAHGDHTHGIDAVRSLNRLMQSPIPCYADEETLTTIMQSFSYAFGAIDAATLLEKGYFRPTLLPHVITPYVPFEISGVSFLPCVQDHGYGISFGYKFRNIVYATDCVGFSNETLKHYMNADVLILDTLTTRPHPAHFHLDSALHMIKILNPKRAFLTHMGGAMDYDTISDSLPPHVFLCYDGLVIEV